MAKTLKGRIVRVCATPQPTDLNVAGYLGLVWVQVSKVGSIGESGVNTEMSNYDALDTIVVEKSKGTSDAGNPPIECSFVATDPGQIILREAGEPTNEDDYAVMWEDDDGTLYFNRGKISGPTHPNGRNGSFRIDMFKVAANQIEIMVTTAEQSTPVNSLRPMISGPANAPDISDATVLTGNVGLWAGIPNAFAYKWQKDAAGNNAFADIGGETAITYTVGAGTGATNRVRFGVAATNAAGTSAYVYSSPTVPVVA